MTRRPTPQPAASRPRIAKATEDHPAAPRPTKTGQAQVVSENETPTAPISATNSSPQAPPASASPAPPVALVPFSTRIPQELRDHYEWLRFSTRTSVQELVTKALTAYAEQHPRP